MPIIKIKNPNYVDGSGEEKWIDAAIYTNQSNEGVEEAPNNGKDYVRRDSDWVISQKIYDELGITKARFESLLNNAYIIPTLGAVPDETTLVYVDGEYNVNFKIGDYCRVRNTNSEYGYDFFRLYDIKDGLAVWSAAETEGSGSAGGETVLISLISNQSASDNALLGASIQVYDVTADETLSETTWEGTEIILTVPKEHTYTVLVGEVSGYKTPSVKTLDAVNGATRILNMQYDCTILTVNFTSNHSADTSKATATISYDSVSQTVSSGQSVKIPYDAQVNITCSKILYYKTPIITQFTAGTTTKEISAEYITSMLNVAFTKNQTVGGTPTISVVTDEQTRSFTGNASNIPCAPDSSVTVNFGGLTYYKTPASQTFTKSLNTETKQGDYLSEKVTCVLSTDDSKVVTNQVITLTCSSSSSYSKTYTCTSTSTSGDSGFVQYIPYGYRYSITANNYFSYATISAQTYTANTANRTINLQYIYTTYTLKISLGTDADGDDSYTITTNGTSRSYDGYDEPTLTVPAQSSVSIKYYGECKYITYYCLPESEERGTPVYNSNQTDNYQATISNIIISSNTIISIYPQSGDPYELINNSKFKSGSSYYFYMGYGNLFPSNAVDQINAGNYSISDLRWAMSGSNKDYRDYSSDGGLYAIHSAGREFGWFSEQLLAAICKNGLFSNYSQAPFYYDTDLNDYSTRLRGKTASLFKKTCLDGSTVYMYKVSSYQTFIDQYSNNCYVQWWGIGYS